MKVELETVQEVITRITDPKIAQKVVDALEKQAREEKAEEAAVKEAAKEPKIKKRLAVVITYADQKPNVEDFCAFIVQIPEEANHLQIPEKLQQVAKAFNGTKKGQRNPLKTVGETFESASPKFFKTEGLQSKSKYPSVIITARNALA
jgi:hypothetical protein